MGKSPLSLLLIFAMGGALAQVPEADPDRVIQQAEDALQHWQARLETQMSDGDGSRSAPIQSLTRAEAEARLATLKAYLAEMAATRATLEDQLRDRREALEVGVRRALESWRPLDRRSIAIDEVPSPPLLDAAPPSVKATAGDDGAGRTARSPATDDRGGGADDLEDVLQRQLQRDDNTSLESALEALLQDNN